MPVRLDVCGLLLALSLTDSDPVVAPVPVGLKTTLMVQCVFFARLLPQVVVETANAPLVEMLMLSKVTFRSLVKVKVLGALVAPTFVLANVALSTLWD